MNKWLALIGRICFSAIFIMSGLMSHLIGNAGAAKYAGAMGVPYPRVMVAVSGVMILAGGLMILLGWMTTAGAWLIVLFLVPTTVMMHRNFADQMQMTMFMKNLSMLGGPFSSLFTDRAS